MKRLFSLVLALALIVSLGVTAFAATTGSITITNATIDKTYKLFKFFDATYEADAGGDPILDADGKAKVSYTIDKTNQFYDAMFGTSGTASAYFTCTPVVGSTDTFVVEKLATAGDYDVIAYLTSLVKATGVTPVASKTAEDQTVKFEDLETGYYVIDREEASSSVTITTNMPDVTVIDKNQNPNVDSSFDKQVWDDATSTWVESSAANVGDKIAWQIPFTATNYDGDEIVMYYSVRDTKSSSLWVEFDDIVVKVNNTELKNGYYYCANEAGGINSAEWDYLRWDSATVKAPENANWYLIHYGYDDFEIVIPWLTGHTFTGVQSLTRGYELTFDWKKDGTGTSVSKFTSPADVVLEYSAIVGADAANTTAQNTATLKWTTNKKTTGPEYPETTNTKVYNLGITKIANDTANTRLAGAVFELYRDAACTEPVYVIPTNNEGVYVLDDKDVNVSGTHRKTSREIYTGYWESYVAADAFRGDMVTPASGQLVIMGLDAGTYYLKEVTPPAGYNPLPSVQEVQVGAGVNSAVYSNNYKDLANTDITYQVSHIEIINSQGVELPSTGGEGTMMLITIGTMLAIGFAVLLITHKKMSIYHD